MVMGAWIEIILKAIVKEREICSLFFYSICTQLLLQRKQVRALKHIRLKSVPECSYTNGIRQISLEEEISHHCAAWINYTDEQYV